MKINKIIQGDCLEVLKKFPDNSIDTIITDPPYALGFMGKAWDKFPSEIGPKKPFANQSKEQKLGGNKYQKWTKKWAKETLRIAKPGTTLLCFGGTRTYHRLACAIEDAGWILKDCIMWLYGSGFPKATDIALQLDKKAGVQGQRGVGGFNTGGIQEQQNRKAKLYKGSKTDGSKLKEYKNAKTPEAKLWKGWKSHGLKPAYEPILVAMKSNEGSYANNALKWKVSGLNIDGGRIPCQIKADSHKQRNSGTLAGGGRSLEEKYNKSKFPKGKYTTDTPVGKIRNELRMPDKNPNSRFPANVILDEETAKILDKQSGINKSTGGRIGKKDESNINFGLNGKYEKGDPGFGDKGGASRFFYIAKASRTERNIGCEELENKPAGMAMRDDKFTRENMGNTPAVDREPVKNFHPTVKPLKLMEYLCILTKTPTGGIVLDPFAGSGTTCMAAKKIGRDYIGIEKEKEYCKIAEARIKAIQKPML